MTITTEEGLGTIDAAPAPGASVAAPSASPYLAVTDQELDRFDELRRLIPVALAGVFTGIFVATVVGAIRTLFAGGAETGLIDTLQVVVNALSLGVAVTSAFFVMRGRTEIARSLASIRHRGRITIAPEDQEPSLP
jgi:hypothetical protein